MLVSTCIRLFYISGLAMFIWYIDLRWTLLGNELGKTIGNIFTLNWWFAPINLITAIFSIIFLTIGLLDFNQSFLIKPMHWIAGFLCARNIWYTLEDVIDYINFPSEKQLMFIIIDILMVINTGIWIYIYRSMN